MAKVLYIQASPRKDRSKSIQVADAFIDTYMELHPNDEIIVLNLYDKILPPFDGFVIKAKYNILHGQPHTDEDKNAWKEVEDIIAEFKSADKYVFAVPMWNFGIPYRLKQYIDIIVQPAYTFQTDPVSGYVGLVTGKPAALIYARGGDYSNPEKQQILDYQRKYMETILGFIGFTDFRSIYVQPTLSAGDEVAQKKTTQAIEEAKQRAQNF